MSKTFGKIKYLAMNLLAPGIGQLALHWWLRGTLQLVSSVICFVLAAWCIVGPLLSNVSRIMKDNDAKLENPDLVTFFYYFLALVAIWIWSFLDIIIFCRPVDSSADSNNENEGGCNEAGEV